ncbi:MAG: selenoprotein B glycine/betaine/sarcosine/D-proline reductase [Rickettsiales bacterium]|jgi:D-proline reductase (dithiol) PrdB|nr:selenoprotein B glycine/betaine/sarcosine/D-proline reductase [Rickettsiales bacterium]
MAKLSDFDEIGRDFYESMPMPEFTYTPWVVPKPIAKARVAIISTAGLQLRGDRPFSVNSTDYRILPSNASSADLVMSHISINFDRSGFQKDHNVALPIDRLNEFVADGKIGSAAAFHYSFMGATHPDKLEYAANQLADVLKKDHVDSVLLVPI